MRNEYRPWEKLGVTELGYFKKRYLDSSVRIDELETEIRKWENASIAMLHRKEVLQARVNRQADTIKRLQEAYLPGNWEKLEKYKRVVDAAKELVFGKSADSTDTDEYPELEKALRELGGSKRCWI